MEKWVVCAKRADFQKISQEFGIDPVIARLIRNRDVEGSENIRSYLYGTLKELPSPWLLKDMHEAVEILLKKIREHKNPDYWRLRYRWCDFNLYSFKRISAAGS